VIYLYILILSDFCLEDDSGVVMHNKPNYMFASCGILRRLLLPQPTGEAFRRIHHQARTDSREREQRIVTDSHDAY
jgi:hypothetical protein